MGYANGHTSNGHRIEPGDAVSRAISAAVRDAVGQGLVYGQSRELGTIHMGPGGAVRFEPAPRQAA